MVDELLAGYDWQVSHLQVDVVTVGVDGFVHMHLVVKCYRFHEVFTMIDKLSTG